jgi:predicted acylesterase/phospholipase RssA
MSSIVGDVLEDLFGPTRLGELALPIAIPVTLMSLRGRRRRLLTAGDDITVVEAVLASCFIPGPYSRIVVVDRCLAVDGAWDVRTPIDAVQHLGATHIVAVVTNPAGELQLGFPTRDHLRPPVDCVVVGPGQPLPIGAWDTDRGRIQGAIRAGQLATERALTAGHLPGTSETAS